MKTWLLSLDSDTTQATIHATHIKMHETAAEKRHHLGQIHLRQVRELTVSVVCTVVRGGMQDG
jgi:hypothetical protein